MMMSPDTYKELCREKSYKELIRERDGLIREIRRLEKVVFKHDLTDEIWMTSPDPELQYMLSLEYLSRLCQLMSERENYE